ncbi:adhesion G protein-coupled receptor L4-like isoform X2 [Limulus polyphemus]|uniref:Adhesion G protein-coupled receptor L4-like isoform X2 n=1 Tax=Limulus polyphemus TaxID=6850 RepID=A0ABM1SI93_LIMPO|nr:adhesion G protein-coupled receptor L4-like isoform X2 [Limulus polyphemus]
MGVVFILIYVFLKFGTHNVTAIDSKNENLSGNIWYSKEGNPELNEVERDFRKLSRKENPLIRSGISDSQMIYTGYTGALLVVQDKPKNNKGLDDRPLFENTYSDNSDEMSSLSTSDQSFNLEKNNSSYPPLDPKQSESFHDVRILRHLNVSRKGASTDLNLSVLSDRHRSSEQFNLSRNGRFSTDVGKSYSKKPSHNLNIAPKKSFLFWKDLTTDESDVAINISMPSSELLTSREHVEWNVCIKDVEHNRTWSEEKGGVLITMACPDSYKGQIFRMCHITGLWDDPDYQDCRLVNLANLKQTLQITHNLKNGLDKALACYNVFGELESILTEEIIYNQQDLLEATEIMTYALGASSSLLTHSNLSSSLIRVVMQCVDRILMVDLLKKEPTSKEQSLRYFQTLILALQQFIMKYTWELAACPNFTALNRHGYQAAFTHHGYQISDKLVIYNDYKNTPERESHAESSRNWIVCGVQVSGLKYILTTENVIVRSALSIVTIHKEVATGDELNYDIKYNITLAVLDSISDDYVTECATMWNTSRIWKYDDCQLVEQLDGHVTCSCSGVGVVAVVDRRRPPKEELRENNAVSSVIIIGCAIFLVAIAFTLVTVPFNFRTTNPGPPIILVNVLFAMAVNQFIFIFGAGATSGKVFCTSISLLLHYLHLVASFWMVTYVENLHRRLLNFPDTKFRIFGYFLVSWIIPAIFVFFCFAYYPNGYETTLYCWLSVHRGMGISFLVPMVLLIMANTVFIIASLRKYLFLRAITPRDEINKMRLYLRSAMAVLPWHFINWFFSVLALEYSSTTTLHYVFALTNATQGIIIFQSNWASYPKAENISFSGPTKSRKCTEPRYPKTAETVSVISQVEKEISALNRGNFYESDRRPLFVKSSVSVLDVV